MANKHPNKKMIEYSAMSKVELQQTILSKSEDLFRDRLQLKTGQLGKTHQIRETRRNIARMKTLVRAQEIAAIAEAKEKEQVAAKPAAKKSVKKSAQKSSKTASKK